MAIPQTREEFKTSDEYYEYYDHTDFSFKSERIFRENGKYEPFVYIIEEKTTGIQYVGMRVAKGCLETDLGAKYFTSSKNIKWNGDEFDILHILPCVSNHDAIILESNLIEMLDAVNRKDFYNKSIPSKLFNASGLVFGNRSGKNNSFYGKTHTEELKANHSILLKKLFKNEEIREKIKHTWFGTEKHKDSLIKKYGVDNINKIPEIAKKSGEKQSKTKNSEEWKNKVGKAAREKMVKTMKIVGDDGLNTFERIGLIVGKKNSIINKQRVKDGTHQFLGGFYAIKKDGTAEKISREDYKKNKIGPPENWEFVHPTSKEGKRRRNNNV